MFSSNNSHHIGNDPISYSDQALFDYFESNTAMKQETHPPNLSFLSLSPFEDNEIFLQHHHDFLLHQLAEPAETQALMEISSPIKSKMSRKRTVNGKRDRHSKIKTARGLRDRRMRLSLEVAKRFFGLQDMLGFDKASKTVEWLLNKSKAEIHELAKEKKKEKEKEKKKKNNPSCCCCCSSSSSDCEGVSSLDEVVVAKRRTKTTRKSAVLRLLSRECREKARERARERTKEKMKNRTMKCDYLNGEECLRQSVNKSSLDLLNEGKEVKQHLETVEAINKWASSIVFMSSLNSSLQEHQFAEFHQCLGKPWETYNNGV